MSVKRCILRFFAIILFVLGVQNVAHAASSDECTGQTDTKCINIYVAADNKLDPKTYIYTCTYDEVCYAPANCVEGETCNSYNGAITTKYTKPGYKFVGWACSGYSKCDELDRDDYIDGSSGYGELNFLFIENDYTHRPKNESYHTCCCKGHIVFFCFLYTIYQ